MLVHVAKLYISDEGLKRKLVRRQLNLKYWEKFSKILRSSHYRCSIRKGVLKNFSKFTRKYHTCNTCVKDSFNTLQASPGECFLLLANKYFLIKIGEQNRPSFESFTAFLMEFPRTQSYEIFKNNLRRKLRIRKN